MTVKEVKATHSNMFTAAGSVHLNEPEAGRKGGAWTHPQFMDTHSPRNFD